MLECPRALFGQGANRRNGSAREQLQFAALKKFFERAPGYVLLKAHLEYYASLRLVRRVSRGCIQRWSEKVLCGLPRLRQSVVRFRRGSTARFGRVGLW